MSARDAILNRVRAAARSGRIPIWSAKASAFAEAPADSPKPWRRRSAERNSAESAERTDDLVARFFSELKALGVECHVELTADAVRARVTTVAKGQAVFGWDTDRLPYDVGAVLSSPVTETDTRERQAAAALGVTGCHAAIAETGSLVVLSGQGTPRAASLLPPVHLCLVRRADLFDTMEAFFRERAGDIANAACCTFITGPSRTADIELTLTLGVHGPGEVIVVVGP